MIPKMTSKNQSYWPEYFVGFKNLFATFQGKKLTAKKADIKPGKIYVGKLPDSGLSDDEVRSGLRLFTGDVL